MKRRIPYPRPDNESERERAFLEMLRGNQGSIFMICLHFTDRHSDSIHDMYQDIVCALWEAWPNFEGKSSSNTWVNRIALSVAAGAVRAEKKRPDCVPLQPWMFDTIAEESEKSPPDYYRIIEEMKPDDRILLYLILRRIPNSEIADILDTTESAIRKRLSRLRETIDLSKTINENEE